MPNCNPEKSRPCGKICLGWAKNCCIDPTANTGGPTDGVDNADCTDGGKRCNPQRSRPCGKICLGWAKNCRIDPTANTGGPTGGGPPGDQCNRSVTVSFRFAGVPACVVQQNVARAEKIMGDTLGDGTFTDIWYGRGYDDHLTVPIQSIRIGVDGRGATVTLGIPQEVSQREVIRALREWYNGRTAPDTWMAGDLSIPRDGDHELIPQFLT